MSTRTIHIRLSKQLVNRLDTEAKKRLCKTRAELIRQLLREYIEEQK